MIDLVSWKVNRQSLWGELSDTGVDVALLQETPRPPVSTFVDCVPEVSGDWSTTHWRSELRTCVALLSTRVRFTARPLRDPQSSDFTALGVSRRETLAAAESAVAKTSSLLPSPLTQPGSRHLGVTSSSTQTPQLTDCSRTYRVLLLAATESEWSSPATSTSSSATASMETRTSGRDINPSLTEPQQWACNL